MVTAKLLSSIYLSECLSFSGMIEKISDLKPKHLAEYENNGTGSTLSIVQLSLWSQQSFFFLQIIFAAFTTIQIVRSYNVVTQTDKKLK